MKYPIDSPLLPGELEFLRRSHYETGEALFNLVGHQKVKLEDVPMGIRVEADLYIAALRVSFAHGHDPFVEDVKMIMSDILEIAKNPDTWLYQNRLCSMIRFLKIEISMFFQSEDQCEKTTDIFMNDIFTPFEKELSQILGSEEEWTR